MEQKDFLSTSELAKILGVSRIAVHKKIKKGEIAATKIGRNYVIAKKDLGGVLQGTIGESEKREVAASVKKTVKEYGETLKLLGKE